MDVPAENWSQDQTVMHWLIWAFIFNIHTKDSFLNDTFPVLGTIDRAGKLAFEIPK